MSKAQEGGWFLLYSDRKTNWGAGDGSSPLTHALCKDPGLPDINEASKTQGKSPSSPGQSSQRGLLQMGIKPGGGEIMPHNNMAPGGDKPLAQGNST